MSAREDILQKVRTAIQDVTEENPTLDVPLSWSYGQPLATADVLADFVEKVRDYRATVVRVPPKCRRRSRRLWPPAARPARCCRPAYRQRGRQR